MSRVDRATYDGYVQGILQFFSGDVTALSLDLEGRMQAAAADRDYETAARLRDSLAHVERASDTQQVLLSDRDDLDAVGVATDGLQACVVRLEVRRGRVVGRASLSADLVEELDDSALRTRFLGDLYDEDHPPPREVVIDLLPDDAEAVSSWLAAMRGGPVRMASPASGKRRGVIDLASTNAAEDLRRRGLRRAADHNARSRALVELQEALGLERPPSASSATT